MSRIDMVCPKCGTENSGESRYCMNCAGLLEIRPAIEVPLEQSPVGFEARSGRGADEDLVNADRRSVELMLKTEESDALLWPPETVFVPTLDADNENVSQEYSGSREAVFEDDQADDVFEQSLSGLRLEDLSEPAEADEPVQILEKVPSAEDSPTPVESEQIAVSVFPIPAPEYIADSDSNLASTEAIVDKRSDPAGRRWGRTLLRFTGMILAVIVLFGAGVGTGIWLMGGGTMVEIPTLADVPVVEEEIRPPSPPRDMAYVPGGEFLMGSDTGDTLSMPAHLVTVGPFFIDLTEVTNEAYLKFVTATEHDPPSGWKNGVYAEGQGAFPVTGVTWYEAAEYAAWLGKRLPTEAEWEFAARGVDGRIYPWGNQWDSTLANADNVAKGIRRVGEGGKSPFGLSDMSGNAWEWTASDARAYSTGKEFPWSRLRLKIIRGGNWQSGNRTATAIFRGYYGAAGEKEYNGTSFRCVKSLAKE